MATIFETDLHDYNKTENHARQAIDASWRALPHRRDRLRQINSKLLPDEFGYIDEETHARLDSS